MCVCQSFFFFESGINRVALDLTGSVEDVDGSLDDSFAIKWREDHILDEFRKSHNGLRVWRNSIRWFC